MKDEPERLRELRAEIHGAIADQNDPNAREGDLDGSLAEILRAAYEHGQAEVTERVRAALAHEQSQ